MDRGELCLSPSKIHFAGNPKVRLYLYLQHYKVQPNEKNTIL